MARPREHDEDTRDRLLTVAGTLLADEGAGALSVRRVATEVGTTTRAIYSLFGSKEGLVREMYVEGFANLDARLREVEGVPDPTERIRRLAHAYRVSALDKPHLYDVMFSCPVPEFEPGPADAELALGTLGRLRAAIVAAVEAGAIVGDPDDLTFAMWGLVHGLASLEIAGTPEQVDADAVWTSAVDGMLRGLAPQS